VLYRRKESAFWWVQFKHRGSLVRRSTGETNRKRAEAKAREIRVEVEKETGPSGRAEGVHLAVLEELHIKRLRGRGFSKQRLDDVAHLWSNIYKHLGGELRDSSTLTVAEVIDYEAARKAEGVRGQTIRRERQALRKGLALAKGDGLLARLPFDWEDLEHIKSDPPLREQEAKTRSDEVIDAVLAKLSRKAKTAGHHKMLRFLRLTGLRLEEFRRFQASWIEPAPEGSKAKALLVVPPEASKTQDGRTLPLNAEALEIAEVWGSRFKGKKFNHALWLASEAAGVSPPLTPRDLRATYITHVARRDLPAAQRLAGHKNVATTGRYVELGALEAVEVGVAVLPRRKRHRKDHRRGSQQNRRRRKAQ
jgi:integrase